MNDGTYTEATHDMTVVQFRRCDITSTVQYRYYFSRLHPFFSEQKETRYRYLLSRTCSVDYDDTRTCTCILVLAVNNCTPTTASVMTDSSRSNQSVSSSLIGRSQVRRGLEKERTRIELIQLNQN